MMARDGLLEQLQRLAEDLPGSVVHDVARAIERSPTGDWGGIRRRVTGVIAHPHYREMTGTLVDVWTTTCPDLTPQSVALALQLATHAAERDRQSQSVELVWTGPSPDATPLRRTDQALLQLINEASARLTIVTFALYRIPLIAEALVAAARRGVSIRLVAESAEESGGKIAHDGIASLGPEVSQRVAVYIWPREKRPTTVKGQFGALHVKCAVADERSLFLSSANLTEHALSLNMEMGLFVRGGPLPGRVSEHLDALIRTGVLERLSTGATASHAPKVG
jgi:phosphatidylserine/phosphatidylglycerophosphate/cardiolipin synthase-like enzyme